MPVVALPPSAAPSDWTRPPDLHELEVTLFGPGYGECLAVHLGEGEWMLVDSCQASGVSLRPIEQGRPVSPPHAHPALAYLLDLGVHLENVTSVVATHWHDDHVRGLDHLIACCPNAQLITSQALNVDELMTALCDVAPLSDRSPPSGVDGMRRALVLAEGQQRWSMHAEGVGLVTRAGTRVVLLAPSTSTCASGQRELGRLLDEQRSVGHVRVPAPRRNDSSIVLWVESPSPSTEAPATISALLGGDLEVGKAGEGWKGLHASKFHRVGARASLVKVAHHGSANGQHMPVWRDMTRDPVALLTPWDRGPGLPGETGLATVRAYASLVASTTSLPERIKRRLGQTRLTLPLEFGRATARARFPAGAERLHSGQDWRLNLVPPARLI